MIATRMTLSPTCWVWGIGLMGYFEPVGSWQGTLKPNPNPTDWTESQSRAQQHSNHQLVVTISHRFHDQWLNAVYLFLTFGRTVCVWNILSSIWKKHRGNTSMVRSDKIWDDLLWRWRVTKGQWVAYVAWPVSIPTLCIVYPSIFHEMSLFF